MHLNDWIAGRNMDKARAGYRNLALRIDGDMSAPTVARGIKLFQAGETPGGFKTAGR